MDRTMCIASLNAGSVPRELIAHTVCVGSPTAPIATRKPPTRRRLGRSATHTMPTPKATTSTSCTRMTVTIGARAGEPRALSSLIA
jgi:hypothetical protein